MRGCLPAGASEPSLGAGRAAPPGLAHCPSTGSRGTAAGSSGDALGKALASVRLGVDGEVADGWANDREASS